MDTAARNNAVSADQSPLDNGAIQRLRHLIPAKTVAEIKGIIRDVLSTTTARMGMSGTKQVLINRLHEQLDSWIRSASWANVRTLSNFAEALRDSKGFMLETSRNAQPSGSNGHHPSSAVNGWGPPSRANMGPAAAYLQRSSSNFGMAGVPPNKTQAGTPSSGYVGQMGTSSAVRTGQVPSRINFKPSPFWKIENFLCAPILLPEAAMQSRREAVLDLKLNPQVSSLIKSQSTSYQVRLFCATKAAAEISERYPATSASVEFPVSCELRINGALYTSSLKGSKKQPGRVPPPNLNKDKTLITREGLLNKITLAYANTTQKYVMVAAFCSYTSAEENVERLRRQKHRTREEIIATMKKAAAEEDIEVGTSTLSLRDPLSYTRIQAPCRSIHCSHAQCFDAIFFFMSNEQSPTWNCPHCNKTIQPDDLFIDGYFEDIVKRVPDDEDAVDFEQDGSWRTKDGKIQSSSDGVAPASTSNLAANPSSSAGAVKGEREGSTNLPPPATNGTSSAGEPSGTTTTQEIVLLDDDSPTPPPSGPTAPTAAGTSQNTNGSSRSTTANLARSGSGGGTATEAIDLTFSDSEDEGPPPAPVRRNPPPPPPPSRGQPHSSAVTSGSGSVGQPTPSSSTLPPRPQTASSNANTNSNMGRPQMANMATGPTSLPPRSAPSAPPRSFFEPPSNTSAASSSPTFAHARMQVNGHGNQHGTSIGQSQSLSPTVAPIAAAPSRPQQLTDFFAPSFSAGTATSQHSQAGQQQMRPSPADTSGGSSNRSYNFWPPRRSVTGDGSGTANGSTTNGNANANGNQNASSPGSAVGNDARSQTGSAQANGSGGATAAPLPTVAIRPREDDPLADNSVSSDGNQANKRARYEATTGGPGEGSSSRDSVMNGLNSSSEPGRGRSAASSPLTPLERIEPVYPASTSSGGQPLNRPPTTTTTATARRHSTSSSSTEEGEISASPPPTRPTRRREPIVDESFDTVPTPNDTGGGPTQTSNSSSRQSDWDDYDELIEDGNDSLYANLPDTIG
ncbi:unnamed protein product [Sympodiomycopsis kandeliae]